MDIQAELPEDFEGMSDEEKIRELEALKEDFNTETDAGALKKRMVEELIEEYRN